MVTSRVLFLRHKKKVPANAKTRAMSNPTTTPMVLSLCDCWAAAVEISWVGGACEVEDELDDVAFCDALVGWWD